MRDYSLTTRVLAEVNDARPFTMRISDTQHRRECIDTVRASALPEFLCAAIPPAVAERLANLSSEIAAVLNVSPTTDALWAASLIDLTTTASDGRRLDRAIARLMEVRARDGQCDDSRATTIFLGGVGNIAVTVHFRGVMLFRMGSGGASDSLIEALVPDCEGATPPCGTSDTYGVHHLDGTIAREHFSRMLIEPADSTIKRPDINLRGATVEIGDMGGGNIPLAGHGAGFADAAAIVPPDGSGDLLELDPGARPSVVK